MGKIRKKNRLIRIYQQIKRFHWYPEPGSNRHGSLHWCLRPTRLPIPPSGQNNFSVAATKIHINSLSASVIQENYTHFLLEPLLQPSKYHAKTTSLLPNNCFESSLPAEKIQYTLERDCSFCQNNSTIGSIVPIYNRRHHTLPDYRDMLHATNDLPTRHSNSPAHRHYA